MDVNVEDIAVCKKRLSITIGREEIDAKFNERFSELEREAIVPGFRPGRAPRRLIEKRFHEAVTEEVRAKLVAEAFEKALEEQKLNIVGEPDIDPEKITLPDEGPMTFSVDLEVRPEFELPDDYAHIPIDQVERPEVTDETVEKALQRLREQHGEMGPAGGDGQIQEGDLVMADLTIQAGDVMVVDHQNVRLPVAQVAIEGIRLEALPDLLKGAKAGEDKTTKITIGQEADNENVRGQEADLTVRINEVQRMRLPTDEALLAAADYEDMDSLRAAVRRQQQSQTEAQFREAQEEAVRNWLLERMPFDLPEDLVARHANRLLQRRLVSLQYRGVPADELEQHLGEIQTTTNEQAARDLRLYFILDAIAKKEDIEVADAEVDARIRFMAAQYSRRAERLREEMEASGHLDSMRGQILEDKVVRLLLERTTKPSEEPAAPAPPAETETLAEPAAEAETETPAEPAAEAETPGAADAQAQAEDDVEST